MAFRSKSDPTDSDAYNWPDLARFWAAKAADTAGGATGAGDKASRYAHLAQAFATVALMEQGEARG